MPRKRESIVGSLRRRERVGWPPRGRGVRGGVTRSREAEIYNGQDTEVTTVRQC